MMHVRDITYQPKVGDRIMHDRFGLGIIQRIYDKKLDIRFDAEPNNRTFILIVAILHITPLGQLSSPGELK